MEQLSLFGNFEGDAPKKKEHKPKAVVDKKKQIEMATANEPEAENLTSATTEQQPMGVSQWVDTSTLTKVYYTITEVATMFKVNASMLRFWEKEFPTQLSKVKKNKKGDRYYNAQDIEKIKLLYHLIKERKMTHEGAREYLKDTRKKVKEDIHLLENLQSIKSFLLDLKKSIAH